MNQSTNSQWNRPEPFDQMATLTEDDFSDFLNLDNIGFDHSTFDGSRVDMQDAQAAQSQLDNALFQDQQAIIDMQQYSDIQNTSAHLNTIQQNVQEPRHLQHGQHTATMDFAMPVQYQQDTQQYAMPHGQNYQHHFSVPPTPNSVEMHGTYLQDGQQALDGHVPYEMEQHFQMHKHDVMVALTPLVSPHMSRNLRSPTVVLPDFTMPGAYLSPLTSPALHPQPNHTHFHTYSQPRTAESSLAPSPVVLAMDMIEDVSSSVDERPRKARKRTPSVKATKSGARHRVSQTTSNQARSASLSIHVSSNLPMDNGPSPDSTVSPVHTPHGQDSSKSTKSASPQPPTEGSMAPPPLKHASVHGTPIVPSMLMQDQGTGLPPATPASLMRLRQQQQSGILNASPSISQNDMTSPTTRALGQSLEDLRLPTAAFPQTSSGKPIAPRIFTDTRLQSAAASPASAAPSKISTPQSVLSSPAISTANGKFEAKNSRGSRKRNNAGPSLVSPAIRPKISPNIKALLPEGSMASNSETHALLLASKSNYQNIIEGTTLPGVNYPAELSTNLTSKRTSHKIAEQGRRNRINTALQEMQSLLPSPSAFNGADIATSTVKESTTSPDEGGSPDEEGGAASVSATPTVKGKEPGTSSSGARTPALVAAAAAAAAAQGGNSKAATVELAIEYIKHLNSRLAEKERENERLRAEVLSLSKGTGDVDGGVGIVAPSDADVAMEDSPLSDAEPRSGDATPSSVKPEEVLAKASPAQDS